MKFHWTTSKVRWKDSVTIGLAILTGFQTIAEISGFFEEEIIKKNCLVGKTSLDSLYFCSNYYHSLYNQAFDYI